ncbi:MAG: T9SS type A sorting domain-containing protein [Calditrichaeota bacterium]|nr:T9SS type A sorting domain-containing protein [Calditrichota bacterium]
MSAQILRFTFVLLVLSISTATPSFASVQKSQTETTERDEANTTLNVPDDYRTIQSAIEAAENGDLVLVQRGDYLDNLDFHGKIITVASEFINSGDGADMFGTTIYPAEVRSIVTFANEETAEAQLIGFRIRDGRPSDIGNNQYRGGGIYCVNSGPTISNCYFATNGNYAEFDRRLHRDEDETWCGGGMAFENSTASILNCGFEKNFAFSYGGGIYIAGQSNITIRNCEFEENESAFGGGIAVMGESRIDISDCRFFQNTAILRDNEFGYGGAVYFGETVEGFVRQCWIYEGVAQGKGAGVYIGLNSNVRIERCLIFDNWAPLGTAIYNYAATTEIIHCTIHGNTADVRAGGIYMEGSGYILNPPVIVNSIVWNNGETQMFVDTDIDPENLDFSYSDIQCDERGIPSSNGGFIELGAGNLNVDPRLVHPTWEGGPWDFNLLEDSPCVDAGIDIGWEFNGNAPDMGALESQYSTNIERKEKPAIAESVRLSVYPNPFNAAMALNFSVSHFGQINLKVLNTNGGLTSEFLNGYYKPGDYSLIWNAENLPTGMYFIRLETRESGVILQRAILIK